MAPPRRPFPRKGKTMKSSSCKPHSKSPSPPILHQESVDSMGGKMDSDGYIGLLSPDVMRERWDSNEDGSNAVLLPAKGKKKAEGSDKNSKRGKSKELTVLSKSKMKKLKRLQEEKEKKLLLSESIRTLEKYKLSDAAHSIMHSSGTIGQSETMREKRRRAVQLSKAGLEVPEDGPPLKKGDFKYAPENEVSLRTESDESQPEEVMECLERDDCNQVAVKSNPKVGSNSPADVEGPSVIVKEKDSSTCIIGDQNYSAPISCSSGKGQDSTSYKEQEVDGSNILCKSIESPAELLVHGYSSIPIVVRVSRPKEIEEQRRDLPIIMMEQEIMEAINEQSIVILCGETGCGKTTQVPQFLFEAGFGSKNSSNRQGMIGVTQPRRVAVLATAKRVSFELGVRLGKEVGFQVRHDKVIGDGCVIKFMTDGILLREVQSDFLLKRYSVIILDEAHERSLNTDILIGLLSRVIELRKKLYVDQQQKVLSGVRINPENLISPLKLVLMSATMRVEDFSSNRKLFHKSPPVLEVPVRQFPVTTHFTKKTQQDYLGQAYKKVMSIHKRLPPGGILVFVTGQREVESLCKKLRRASQRLSENSSRGKVDNEIPVGPGVDMKDISEAFETAGSSPDQQTDRFGIYDEDYGSSGEDSHPSDSESDSELESDSEDENSVKSGTSEKSDLILDYLRNSESLSSLKASFESLAGNSSIVNNNEKPTIPDSPTHEESLEPTVRSPGALYVLPLYAMLPATAQLRIFEDAPEGERLLVVATNVAETSLTIPGIKYVVDTGKQKVKKYNYSNGIATYEVQWISKASAAQRAGRAGRTGPGHCYRLYSSAAFGKDDIFPEFSIPEISKIPVDGVVLLMKYMGIDKVANFPFPSPPEQQALKEAENCLRALDALDSQGRLTSIGRSMAQYPMSPRHSRMILTVIQIMKNQLVDDRAKILLAYAVSAASALSFSNPFVMQFGGTHGDADDKDGEEMNDSEKMQDQQEKLSKRKKKAMAKEVRDRLRNSSSDALTIAYSLQLFEISKNPVEFCSTNSLHYKTMEEMSKLRKQLLQLIFHRSKLCPEFSLNGGSFEDVEHSWRSSSDKQPFKLNVQEEKLLGKAICAGWADRVAKRIRTISKSQEEDGKVRAGRYSTCASDDPVYLHRWSSVSHVAPQFLVYTELLQTKRPYMHGATIVEPEWLINYAAPLCTFSGPLTDPKPYYDPLHDQVFCWVKSTFGRHNWQLPLHPSPIKDDTLRVSVFACALLEGCVLPCLKTAQKFLAAPPSSILRPEALGQRRVGDLVCRLKIGSRTIDSREKLKEAWNVDSQFLFLEILNWFQKDFHHLFGELWEQMHSEVLKSNVGKKSRKRVKC